ncbi:MAG: hypothetical protein E7253_00300 [Lachnospiraceae bacterium]|nr:hypothetical protein [Lachnospiraceae bacterium]
MWKKLIMNVSETFASNGESEHENKVDTRMNLFYLVFGILFLLFIAVMFYRSGVVKGLNRNADRLREQTIKERDAVTITAGNVYDSKEQLLVEHKNPNEAGVYTDGTLYSPLIGYLRSRTAVQDETGNVTYKADGERLLKLYTTEKEDLFQNTGIDGRKGRDLILTLEHELQAEVDRLLTKEMGTEARGMAIVMNAKTGEILACVSHPSYDYNDLTNSLAAMNQTADEEEVRYPISHKGLVSPGSIFKIIVAAALIDNGLEDLTVLDNNQEINGIMVENSYGSTGRYINYHTALEKSSNVFFAQAAYLLGKDKLDEAAAKFMIGNDKIYDFGTVAGYWNIDESDPVSLVNAGYGQADTLFSGMTAAMMTQAVANDGKMMEPYLIQEIRDANGHTVEYGEPKVLSEVTGKETADKVTAAMLAATKSHLHVVEGASNRAVYEKYEIASKTGTGENGDAGDTNNAWVVSFAPASDPQYVVVANQCKTDKYGQDLMDTVAGIYGYLFEEN